MRVLYIHQYFAEPDSVGGTRSYEFAKRLVREGHNVTMVTSTAFLPRHRTENVQGIVHYWVDGIEVLAIPSNYSNAYSAIKRMGAFATFALRSSVTTLRTTTPDVIFATSTPLTVALPALAARRRFKRNLVFEVRDLWPEVPIDLGKLRNRCLRRLAYALAAHVYARSKAVIALSPGMADGIVRLAPESSIYVIPNAADLDLFGESTTQRDRDVVLDTLGAGDFPPQCPVAVYCGTLGYANGTTWLLDLAERVQSLGSDVRFLIIGDGAERERLRSIAAERQLLNHRVVFAPPIAKKDVPAALSAASICFSVFADFDSLETTSPNKFFDALAAAKPVAINYGGWQAEMLRKSGAGVVLDRHIEVAADQLLDFLRSADFATAGRRARELAESQFDRDTLYARWRDVLIEAVSR